MPVDYYVRGINKADLDALVAYLRSLPPIKNACPRPSLRNSSGGGNLGGGGGPGAPGVGHGEPVLEAARGLGRCRDLAGATSATCRRSHLEHPVRDAERALADRLEHAVDRRRHQRGRADVAERALGREVAVGAAAADDLDDLLGDVEAGLRREVLGAVGEERRAPTTSAASQPAAESSSTRRAASRCTRSSPMWRCTVGIVAPPARSRASRCACAA